MRVLRLSFLLLLFGLILASCHKQADRLISQAGELMQSHPDSALRLLQAIDRYSLSDERLARYAIIYSIAQNKSGIDICSDSLLRIAFDYYSQHSKDTFYARSRYYMGLYYTLVDSTKQSEDCLRTAARYAGQRREYYTQYLALNRLSASVRYSDAPLALEYGKQALQVYSEHCSPNVTNKILLLLDIGTAYLLCAGKEDSALVYMDIALEEAQLHSDTVMKGAVLQQKSLIYSKLKDYQQALACVKAAWKAIPEKNLNLVSCLANCYADADSAAQARELFLAITEVGSNGQKYLAYQSLSHLSAKEHNTSSYLTYLDSAYEYMERMYIDMQETKAAYFQDLILREQENRLQQEKILRRELSLLYCLIFLIIVVMSSVYVYINIKNKTKRRLAVEQERHLLSEQFAREQYTRDIENKNAQLSLMRKMVMEKYDFHKRLEEQKKSGKHITLAPKDWEEISAFLEVVSDGFPGRLKTSFPNLREKDYQFCMLVRLGFSGKDLANIYGIAETSIKQKLVNYKQRLDIPDQSISFKQFIVNF